MLNQGYIKFDKKKISLAIDHHISWERERERESTWARHLSPLFESCLRGVSPTNLSAIYVVEPKTTQTH